MRKKLHVLFYLALIYSTSYSQELKSPSIERDRIEKFVSDNFRNEKLKDSVALYTFAIKITIDKDRPKNAVKKIESNDSLYYKVLPNLDSLLHNIDFGVFAEGGGIKEIILPFVIVLEDYEGNKQQSAVGIADVSRSYNKLLFYGYDDFDYSNTYLFPLVIRANKKTYW